MVDTNLDYWRIHLADCKARQSTRYHFMAITISILGQPRKKEDCRPRQSTHYPSMKMIISILGQPLIIFKIGGTNSISLQKKETAGGPVSCIKFDSL